MPVSEKQLRGGEVPWRGCMGTLRVSLVPSLLGSSTTFHLCQERRSEITGWSSGFKVLCLCILVSNDIQSCQIRDRNA